MVKLKYKGLIIGGMMCCMTVFAGCTIPDTIGLLVGTPVQEDVEGTDVNKNAYVIDDSVEKPHFVKNLGGPIEYALKAEAEALSVNCTVEDGGTLTYQWYRNNTNSNGGGTLIAGATSDSYVPDTSKSGVTYYYVVITNNIDNHIQMVTSNTQCIRVKETEEVLAGEWKQNDTGIWYEYEDGTYPADEWKYIDGETYVFNEHGYARTGWYEYEDNWYYFYENGAMAHDTEVEGYYLGSDGTMQ